MCRHGLRMLSASGRAEYVLVSPSRDALPKDLCRSLDLLTAQRPQIRVVPTGKDGPQAPGLTWSLHQSFTKNSMQLDCTALEEMFLGRNKLSEEETAQKWNEIVSQRRSVLYDDSDDNRATAGGSTFGDGGRLQRELDVAIAAVHRASFMSRSLQKNFLSVSKDDKSPVTIADFAVQALILDALHQAFPDDKFIAEEDSSFLKSDAAVRSAVLDALSSATGSQWSEQRLYNAVDLGAFEGKASRVWVLDPVDGTTGFIRGLHYCIALALLVDGKPQASFMGCPNVNLERVLAPDVAASKGQQVADIDDSLDVDTARVHPVSAGSIFYAVSGRGAWARTLGMPLGAGFEVTVSGVEDSSQAALCEAMEASHGSRDVTEGIAKRLGLTREYLRLHGQCKYCVVGAGAAEGNLRLPGPGYREKIWDHAPGAHFITEAGGLVTDLEGRQLDFSEGRLLSANVAGILAANTALHSKILAAISEERKIKERKGQ